MRTINFINGDFYHVYNRGVDKRNIFIDRFDKRGFLKRLEKCITPKDSTNKTDENIEIHAFCLMPNHYHLLLKQTRDAGISRFMSRLGNSYTKYFNTRHERSGRLFESSFKSKHVLNDRYLIYLSAYIHLNPLDILGAKTVNEVVGKLKKYHWSSFQSYTKTNRFDFVKTNTILEYFSSKTEYETYLKNVSLMPSFEQLSST